MGKKKKKETTSVYHCKYFGGQISWLMRYKIFSYML